MNATTLPVRLFESHRVTLPEGGIFYADGKPVMEDTLDAVLKKLKLPNLKARAKATSSGVLINGRVYPGRRMKDSVHYFTKDHGKPVLDRHPNPENKFDNPNRVGRVTAAEYVQTWTDKAWMMDYKNPKPNGHAGSGHIVLDTLIAGQENVERVMDKRDLTLSVGFTPTAYICSVCGHDAVSEEGPCGHKAYHTYQLDDAKKQGAFLCFFITGLLIYDHVANVNFPGDPTAQFLSTSFQDAAGDFFASSAFESYQGQLSSLLLIDEANNQSLELQLDPPPVTAVEAPHRKDEAQVTVAVEIDLDATSKETAMAQDTKNPKTDPTATATDTPPEPPAQTDAQDASAQDQTTDVQAGGSAGDTCGAWTQPDPVDGHTHGVAELDDQGNGRTTKAMGSDMDEHDHEIKYGRVKPYSGGEGDSKWVSRHPGTWFYDENGEPKVRVQDEATDVDGKPQLPTTDEQPDSPAETQQDDQDCIEGCSFDFAAADVTQEFALSDELADEVEDFAAEELQDMLDEREAAAAGALPESDAVLTAAARKKIPSRLFCGPNRSFPVHDKPHVRNALARLPQSTRFSSDQKARILACIKKRAKALGVTVSKNSDAATSGEPILTDAADQAVLKTLGKDIATKNSKITQLQGALDERNEELQTAKQQLQDAEMANTKQLIDQVVTLKLALRKPDVQQCKTQDDIQKVRDELAKRSVDSLRDFAQELQVELAAGGGVGAISPADSQPEVGAGSLGGAPSPKVGEDGRTLADSALDGIRNA